MFKSKVDVKPDLQVLSASAEPTEKVDRRISIQEEAQDITNKAALELIRKGSETVGNNSPLPISKSPDAKEKVVSKFEPEAG